MVNFSLSDDDARLLFDRLATAGTRPRLTWYHDCTARAPRLELSGHVLAMHAAKAAGFLISELAAAPGDLLSCTPARSWRLLPWILGSWAAGANVELLGPACPPDPATLAILTEDPQEWAEQAEDAGCDVIALARGDLALAFDGPDLPHGALDAVADSMGQPDIFHPPTTAGITALPLSAAAVQLGASAPVSPAGALISRPPLLDGDTITRIIDRWAGDQRAIVVPAGLSDTERARIAHSEGLT